MTLSKEAVGGSKQDLQTVSVFSVGCAQFPALYLPPSSPPPARTLATQEVALCNGLAEHAAWHLARTVPAILRNRRWPTAKLKAGGAAAAAAAAAGGRRGARAVGGSRGSEMSEIEELVGELRACDPRVLEMAGIEVRHTRDRRYVGHVLKFTEYLLLSLSLSLFLGQWKTTHCFVGVLREKQP